MLGAKGYHSGWFVMFSHRPRRIEMMVHQIRVAAVRNRAAEPDLASKFTAYLSRWSSVHPVRAYEAAQTPPCVKYTKRRTEPRCNTLAARLTLSKLESSMTGPAPQNVANQTITNTLTVIAPQVAPSLGLFQLPYPLTEVTFLRLPNRS